MKTNWINWNKRYTTISVYTVLVFAACYTIFKITGNWASTKETFLGLIKTLSPFIYALIIAYFINPLVIKIEGTIPKRIQRLKIRRSLSILITYSLIISTVVLLLSFVIPQLISSAQDIGKLPETYLPIVQEFLSRDNVEIFNTGYFIDLTLINTYLNDNVVETFSSISTILANFAPVLLSLLTNITTGILNILLGFIIAIYLLISKESALITSRKILFAILPPKNAVNFINLSKESNHIFISFIIGKMIDSLIIGIICFIILLIFNYPYALLLSVIIGITNMIPYFGPFVGGAIGFFLLLFITPVQALWFLLIILLLQQFDGNILGPKILGDSTGLSAFWVIFAIILFGSFFGFSGMFFGVPILAVIKNIFSRQIDSLYNKRTTTL